MKKNNDLSEESWNGMVVKYALEIWISMNIIMLQFFVVVAAHSLINIFNPSPRAKDHNGPF